LVVSAGRGKDTHTRVKRRESLLFVLVILFLFLLLARRRLSCVNFLLLSLPFLFRILSGLFSVRIKFGCFDCGFTFFFNTLGIFVISEFGFLSFALAQLLQILDDGLFDWVGSWAEDVNDVGKRKRLLLKK